MAKGSVKEIDRGWTRIKKDLKSIDNAYTSVGFQAGEVEDEGMLVAVIAFFNEFGTKNIPSRPFMRRAIDNNKDTIDKIKKREYGYVLDGTKSPKEALGMIGEYVLKLVQKEIRELSDPPNADSTIERKGSDNPLIDTGQMRQSVTHVETVK